MTYSDTVSTIAMIVAFVAIPASAYLSYSYAIKGERRKEWNAIAEVLLAHYEQVHEEAEDNSTYSTTTIPIDEFVRIQRRMTASEKKEFRDLVALIVKLRNSKPDAARNKQLSVASSKICKILKLK
ncbi:hypothetical protein MX032_06475 [Enterobacter cloacae subsp. cloacae]|uniref:hypothetical protein n=1 Tax=Enterobacter cloacae TaxID=550 RepID=UPI001FF31DFE|nr:hypothetical protein [Enterobacter cloacae]MCK1075557.1 hypothetical protein [Enterobacter cloacae subsp. cloacae]